MISICRLLVVLAALMAMPGRISACTEQDFSAVIERTAQNLRNENQRHRPALEKKFLELAKLKGWPSEGAVERAYALAQDDKVKTLDAEAAQLLIKLDRLGEADGKKVSCQQLQALKTAADRLLAVTKEKSRHVASRLATIIASARPATSPPPKPAQAAQSGNVPPDRARSAKTRTSPPPAKPSRPPQWATTTKPAPWPNKTIMAGLPKLEQEATDTFSADEIRAAGRGLFGTLSAELASILEFTFRQYGRPNGYIVGNEGGAAFLAGLRFGSGRLVTRRHRHMRVYWQGPSIGYDFGLTGARVLILVYNLKEPEKLFTRFAGLEGAAYLVGGAGITFHKRGRLVLAPIRTGLGVRLGANVGYLKFSRTRDLNPF